MALKQKNGFTLLELLISMFIIILLSSMFLLLSNIQNKKLALSRNAFQLAQDIRWQEEQAMNGTELNCPGGGAAYFLGVHIEKGANNYILFADCDKNKARKYDKGEDIKTVYLENNIVFDIVYPSSSNVDIIFSPPDPTVYINNTIDSPEAVILLKDSGDSVASRKVKVNSAGRIEIE